MYKDKNKDLSWYLQFSLWSSKLYLKSSNKIHNKFAPVFYMYNPWIRNQCPPWVSASQTVPCCQGSDQWHCALCKFVGTIIQPLLVTFGVWNCYNELCYGECQIMIASTTPSDHFDCNWPMGNSTVVNPIVWLCFAVIMDFPHGLHRLLVINVNIPCSRANIWIVCAMNVSLVDWLKHYITKPAAYLSVDISSYQGRIFPKIQPTIFCQIGLTLDKNHAKTQWRSTLSTK